jgi:hypothetical protein
VWVATWVNVSGQRSRQLGIGGNIRRQSRQRHQAVVAAITTESLLYLK